MSNRINPYEPRGEPRGKRMPPPKREQRLAGVPPKKPRRITFRFQVEWGHGEVKLSRQEETD